MIFQAWKNHEHGLAAEWVRATRVCRRWRKVALDTTALWSSVIVQRRLTDDPALEMELDRAHGVALDLVVSCVEMSNGDLEEVLNFVLSRTKAIERLDITSYDGQETTINGFIKDAGIAVVFLSLNDQSWGVDHEWELTPAIFPRLRHLALDQVVPTPGALGPLLTVTHLELRNALRGVHNFLAACPNLQRLRTDARAICYGLYERPVVTLPSLRYLFVEHSMYEVALALGTLRLPSLASFHITDCEANDNDDRFAIQVIPPMVTEVLPPIHHSRFLSLIVGGAREDLSLRGSSGDAFQDEPEWSITMPSFVYDSSHYPSQDEEPASPRPEFPPARFYYLARNGQRLLAHIPHLVNSSNLVQLELHFAHGLPVAHDWVRFFAPMSHLRTLGVGGVTLVSAVLTVFHTDPGMCMELQDVALCAPAGWVRDELRPGLCLSFREVVAGWARERVGAGMGPRSLTIRTPHWKNGPTATEMYTDDGDSGNLDDENRGLITVVGPGSSRSSADHGAAGLTTKPHRPRGLGWLEEIVGGGVVVKDEDCFACGAVYELPEGYSESSNEGTEGSIGYEPYFY
ncbi:hypothetical protein V8D89_007022 [Ganoderma adspersum]